MQYKEFFLGILTLIILLLGLQNYYNLREIKSLELPVRFFDKQTSPPRAYKIRILGAVKHPGNVIVINTPPRLIDAIERAGGFTDNANVEAVNFAENIENAKLIAIPFYFQDEVVIIKYKKYKHKRHKHKKRKHKKKRKKRKKHKKISYTEERFIVKLYRDMLKKDDYLEEYDKLISSAIIGYRNNTKSVKLNNEESIKPNNAEETKPTNDENIEKTNKTENPVKKETKTVKQKKKSEVQLTFNSIDLNIASKEELMQLPGIGEKTAETIIEFRLSNPIKTKEDILKIKGIGSKKLEKILPYIKLDEVMPTNELL